MENKCYIVDNMSICRLPVNTCKYFSENKDNNISDESCYYFIKGRCCNSQAICDVESKKEELFNDINY